MSRRKNLLLAGLMTPSLALGPQAGIAPAAASEALLLAQAAPQGFDPNHEKRPPAQRPAQPAPAPHPAPAAPPAAPFHPAPIQHAPSAPPPSPYPGAGAPPFPRPQLRAAPPAPPAPAIIHPPQQAAPIRQAPPPHPTAAPAAIPIPHPIAPANPAAAQSPSPSIPHENRAPAAGRPPVPAPSGDHGPGAGAPAARIAPAAPIVTPAIGQQPPASPAVPAPPAHSATPPAGGGQNLPPNGSNGAPAHLGGPHPTPAAGGAPEAPAPHGQPPAGTPAQGGNFLPSTAQPGAAPRPNGPPPGAAPAGDHAGAPPAAGPGGRFLPPGQQGAIPPGAPPGAGSVPPHVPPQAGGAAYGVPPAGGPPPSGAAYGGPPAPPHGAPPAGGGPRVSPAAAAAIGAAAGLVGGFVLSQPGAHRLDDVHARRQQFERDGVTVVQEPGRTIVRESGGAFIRHDENERFRELGGNLRSERRGEEYVSVYARRDGGEVLTYTDANGVLLRRLRRFPDGREIILIDNGFRGPPRGFAEEVVVLPPPPIEIAPDAYVVDYGAADERLIYETLTAPPLAPMQRRYTLDEIRYSPSVRAYTRSVDIDTINFDTGSWAITPDQAQRLVTVAEALNEAIKRNPAEVFLIEGHSDAVGSDVDNLSLSDRRAQSVATILSRDFGVPPENLTTQGYGEQYLKVQTQGPSRENRRVTVRRITPLLSGPQAETHRR
ncbi:outer membrane protein OmpA-like peptidoglycan-associated protein [Methylosinus sp. sav-2]|uniref:OmpA family protein n=1 Tax=Methylosinus sp. sav-2 TaxID=2485168 RepID=UPI001065E293|nr:OmpA family protein [Methylosinus sp. sav-2]TDX62766.1 outer membrane protein OmpA-like peptidoglycan-associated protein [Methylosinus sp. sav-2]